MSCKFSLYNLDYNQSLWHYSFVFVLLFGYSLRVHHLMAKSNSKWKTRSNKFPFTLHKTCQYCKKIKSKFYYFGSDKKVSLNRYLEQASYLHAGKQQYLNDKKNLSIKTLWNLYLDHQESRASIGEIKLRHLYDQISLLQDFVRFIRLNRSVSDISTVDFQNYRKKLIKDGRSANAINNRIAVVKAMYNWALDNEVIDSAPRLNAVKKVTPQK